MRLAAFRAKNEVAEFVFADASLLIGGMLLGSDGAGFWGTVAGVAIVVCGLFLGMRVLGSFSAGLSEARGQIHGALSDLRAADRVAKQAYHLLKKQRSDVEALTHKMREAEREFGLAENATRRQLDRARESLERIFGHSSTFSDFNWTNTLEDMIKSHEGRIKCLEENEERKKWL